jgi:hypothetical protein
VDSVFHFLTSYLEFRRSVKLSTRAEVDEARGSPVAGIKLSSKRRSTIDYVDKRP